MWLWRGLTQTLTTLRISLAKGSSISTFWRLKCTLDSKITHLVIKSCQSSHLPMRIMSSLWIWAPCLSSIHGDTWSGKTRLKLSCLQSGQLQSTMTTRTKQLTRSFLDTPSSLRLHRLTRCTLIKLNTCKKCKLEKGWCQIFTFTWNSLRTCITMSITTSSTSWQNREE